MLKSYSKIDMLRLLMGLEAWRSGGDVPMVHKKDKSHRLYGRERKGAGYKIGAWCRQSCFHL